MKVVSKVLVIGSMIVVGGGILAAKRLIPGLRARKRPPAPRETAGSMFVGAVDEVELSAGLARPMRPGVDLEGFDPEEVPSEHAEINDLRTKMPLG